jgi:hypothetical protein
MAMRYIPAGALALVLMACGESVTPGETAPDAPAILAGETDDATSAQAGDTEASDLEAASTGESDGPAPLDVAARDACMAGDEAFADPLPDGSGFASRGADARVHVAWKLEGETGEAILHTPSLEPDTRLTFDGNVADFLRRNMTAGFDRTGLTGAFRSRDGRFCVVQTETEAVEALRAATLTAQGVRALSGG